MGSRHYVNNVNNYDLMGGYWFIKIYCYDLFFLHVCLQLMQFPTPEKIFENEFEIALDTLHKTLSQLPEKIPFKNAQNTAFK